MLPVSFTEAPKEKEPQAVVMAAEEEIVKPPPKLPDLEKYWKPVNEDTTNFTGWTYLLQYVDQEVMFIIHCTLDDGQFYSNRNCFLSPLFRPTRKPLVMRTTRSWATTPTATDTGANTPTTRRTRGTAASARR